MLGFVNIGFADSAKLNHDSVSTENVHLDLLEFLSAPRGVHPDNLGTSSPCRSAATVLVYRQL